MASHALLIKTHFVAYSVKLVCVVCVCVYPCTVADYLQISLTFPCPFSTLLLSAMLRCSGFLYWLILTMCCYL